MSIDPAYVLANSKPWCTDLGNDYTPTSTSLSLRIFEQFINGGVNNDVSGNFVLVDPTWPQGQLDPFLPIPKFILFIQTQTNLDGSVLILGFEIVQVFQQGLTTYFPSRSNSTPVYVTGITVGRGAFGTTRLDLGQRQVTIPGTGYVTGIIGPAWAFRYNTVNAINSLGFRQNINTNIKGAIASNKLMFAQHLVGGDNSKQKTKNKLTFYQTLVLDRKIQWVTASNFLQFNQKTGRLFTEKLFQIYFPFQIPGPTKYFGDATIKPQNLKFNQRVDVFISKVGTTILTFQQLATQYRASVNQAPSNSLQFNQGVVAYKSNFNACEQTFTPVPTLPGA